VVVLVLFGCGEDPAVEECTRVLPTRFSENTTLEPACYLAQENPMFDDGVTLTLVAGTKIIFSPEVGLTINEGHALSARGSAAEPIILTALNAQGWAGLVFSTSNSPNNLLEWVIVERVNNAKLTSEVAGIALTSDSRPVSVAIRHTTVRENQGYGLWLTASSELPGFSDNTFSNNTLGPINADSDTVGLLERSSSYVDNGVEAVTVRASRITRGPTRWSYLGVPYVVGGSIHVDVPWTIEPGVTLKMAPEAELIFAGPEPALMAIGTELLPITFTGQTNRRGAWGGLVFTNADNPDNRLEQVIVEYAGQGAIEANVLLDSTGEPVRLALSHVTLRESAAYGLSMSAEAVLTELTALTVTANTLGPVVGNSEVVHQLTAAGRYTGNDVDRIEVRANRVPGTTWHALGVPYAIDGNVHVDQVWTVEPGVTLLMAKDSSLWVAGDESGLRAIGTAALPDHHHQRRPHGGPLGCRLLRHQPERQQPAGLREPGVWRFDRVG
jgi:hypothetical protein